MASSPMDVWSGAQAGTGHPLLSLCLSPYLVGSGPFLPTKFSHLWLRHYHLSQLSSPALVKHGQLVAGVLMRTQ